MVKKNKKKEDFFFIPALLLISTLLIILFGNIQNTVIPNKNNGDPELEIKISGFWSLAGIEIIGDASGIDAHNWTWAKNQPWCSGNGTLLEPYVIENITINGQNSRSCITIMNSSVYFVIKNCTLFNSGEYQPILDLSSYGAGIFLYNVQNGKIIGCDCSNNNGRGIILVCDCNDNLIVNNTINNNYRANIELFGGGGFYDFNEPCEDNIIMNNTASYSTNHEGISIHNCNHNFVFNNSVINNHGHGISVRSNSSFNRLFNNTSNENQQTGISLYSYALYNSLYGNKIDNNKYAGIGASEYCDHNIIDSNTILRGTATYADGIEIEFGINTSIFNNIIKECPGDGIGLEYCFDSVIRGNFMENMPIYGMGINDCNNTLVYENIITDNINQWDGSIDVLYSNYTLIYNNTFQTSWPCWDENGFHNSWNNSVIGNKWSKYSGKDTNDDGIGDTPYVVYPSGYDYKPIFWDPPKMNIVTPSNNQICTRTAPDYEISVYEGIADTMWYTFNYNSEKFTIFNTNGIIDQDTWKTFGNESIIITFYVNDTKGMIASDSVQLIKDITIRNITLSSPTYHQQFTEPPDFIVWVNNTYLDKMWYTLGANPTKYFFLNNGTIDSVAWIALTDGEVIITFYMNQTNGYTDSCQVIVLKTTPSEKKGIPWNGIEIIIMIMIISQTIYVGNSLRKRLKD